MNYRVINFIIYGDFCLGNIKLNYVILKDASTKKIKISPSKLQSLLKTCENYLTIGINKFESICDLQSAAVVYFNKGELYQILAMHSSQNKLSNSNLIKEKDFIKMVGSYTYSNLTFLPIQNIVQV